MLGTSNAAYAASKGAVIAMTMTAAHQLGRYDINVNAICPGSHARPCPRLPWCNAPRRSRYRRRAGPAPPRSHSHQARQRSGGHCRYGLVSRQPRCPQHHRQAFNVDGGFNYVLAFLMQHVLIKQTTLAYSKAKVRKLRLKIRVRVGPSRIGGTRPLCGARYQKRHAGFSPTLGKKIAKDESTRRLAYGNNYIF